MNIHRFTVTSALIVIGAGLPACGSDDAAGGGGTGTIQIFVVPEETISEGLDPGTDAENVVDGWTIRYSRYLVAVGNFRAGRSETGDTLTEPSVYVLDLASAPAAGYIAAEIADVAAARWDEFGYDIPNAKAGAQVLPPTTEADRDFMVQHGYSVYYEGYGEKAPDTIAFRWGFSAGSSFDDCATEDGFTGFAVPSGGTVQVKPTLHGDHQYFDNVTQGVEITSRRAQWLATCNADADGELTIAELKGCNVATALPSPPYDLTSMKDEDGDGTISVYDYVATQMRTFGDFQGDGECPTRMPID